MPMPMPLSRENEPVSPCVPTAPNILTDLNQPSTSEAPSAPPAPVDFSDNPPSYEDAMNLGDANTVDFNPKYPMFRRQTSYSTGNQ